MVFSAQGSPFNISYKAGLVVLNSFSFCLSVKLFISPSDLNGFPGGSDGKESACNAGDARDTGSVPGLGRSHGEGNGNPLQYSCL